MGMGNTLGEFTSHRACQPAFTTAALIEGSLSLFLLATGSSNFIIPLLFFLFFASLYVGGRAYKNKALKSAKAPDALNAGGTDRSVYDCVLYDQISFERRLVEGGIMKADELTTCNDNSCLNCKDERTKQLEVLRIRLREERRAQAKKQDDDKLDAMSEKSRARVEAYQLQELTRMGRGARMQPCQRCKEATFIETYCPKCFSQLDSAKKVSMTANEKREIERAYLQEMMKEAAQNNQNRKLYNKGYM